MEMRNVKVYQNIKEKELSRQRQAMVCNDVTRSFREIILTHSVIADSHGLVFSRLDPVIYASYGMENWHSPVEMYMIEDDYSKYGQSVESLPSGFVIMIGGLASNAFETYQTHLSISTYIQDGKLKGSIRLGMCLKKIKIIGSHDFVFDMIFKLDDDNISQPLVFLDSLFTTLEENLPSFKVSSGAQIGLQSLVLDFDTFKALEKHQLSSPPLSSSPEFETLGLNADSKAWVDKLSPLYEDNDGLKLAFVEIQKAISILTVDRGLTFCQVWTHHHSYKGLDPYFSTGDRNPKDVGIHIPMRNTNTADLDYAFQFFFSSVILTQNFCETFDSVLLTLADHMPSFKLSSGPQFDHLVLQAGSVIASVDQLSPLKMIKCSSVSASVNFANLKTEFSQLFHHSVSSKNGIDIDYRLTYYNSFHQFTRPFWIQLESDQDLKTCINHCKSKKITQLPIRVVQCHTSNQGFHPRVARHAALVISSDDEA